MSAGERDKATLKTYFKVKFVPDADVVSTILAVNIIHNL